MMRTDDLMRSLVADATPAPRLEPLLRIALVASLAVSAVLFAASLGPRPDLATVATEPRFMFKFVVTLALAGTAIAVALRLARPGMRAHVPALLLAPGLLVAAVLAELAVTPAASWGGRLVGNNALVCLVSVPLLAAPVLVAVLMVLRRGAPLRPALTGAAAGLVAGGLGATLYASHCVDDSPLFVATWYSLAIALVVAAGALAGARLLRW
jgi:hypothetical protein